MLKEYRECVCDDGVKLYVTKSCSQPGVHSKPRAPRCNKTLPKVAANNKRNQLRTVEQYLNYNFHKNDRVVTLTFTDNNLPKSLSELYAIIKKYKNELINYAKNKGIDIKMFYVFDFGEVNQRLHLHVVLSREGLSRGIIKKAWPYGNVYIKRAYLKNGSFGALAQYLMKNVDITRDTLGIKKIYRHYGLDKPSKTIRLITESEMYSVPHYDSCYIDRNNTYFGYDDFGHPYAHYELKKRRALNTYEHTYSEGFAKGQADGFWQYTNVMNNNCVASNTNGSSALIGMHNTVYNAGYKSGLKLGRQKAFESIVTSRFYCQSSGRMFFDGVSYKGYLRIGRYYRYIDNTIYYSNGWYWAPADLGVLYSINQDGTISPLPDGIYSSYGGRNHFRPIYSQNLSVLNPFAAPHNYAICSAS